MRKSTFSTLTAGAMFLTTSLLFACANTPTPTSVPTQISRSKLPHKLPAPLYFLLEGQIWRVARDGQTQQQITHEAAPVESFDVSPVDGSLGYVSANTLRYADAEGLNRQVLLAGSALPPIADALDALNDRMYIAGKIATPRWSPDGRHIAYVQNGLQMITLSSGELNTIHPNDFIPEQGEVTDRLIFASIRSWSPDGQHLLAMGYRYPLRSIYAQNIMLKNLEGYAHTLIACGACTFAWRDDSQAFYIGTPDFGGSEALSRCTSTDGHCTFIGQDVPARTVFFYAYPYAVGADEVYVFIGTNSDPAELPSVYKLYTVQSSGYGTTELRADEVSIRTALWAKDGSGVLIVSASEMGTAPSDVLLWLPVDGSSAVTLPITGAHELRWGKE